MRHALIHRYLINDLNVLDVDMAWATERMPRPMFGAIIWTCALGCKPSGLLTLTSVLSLCWSEALLAVT